MAAELIEQPVVPAPEVGDVAARAAVYVARQRRQARVLAMALVPLLMLSVLQVAAHGGGRDGDGRRGSRVEAAGRGEDEPWDGEEFVVGGPPPTSTTSTTSTAPRGGQRSGAGVDDGGGIEPGPPSDGGLRCEHARNGGNTEIGVTAGKVRLFLPTGVAGAETVVRAVVDRVNAAGGICGRMLDLTTADAAPSDYADEVFASLATPLHAKTDDALERDLIDRARMPIIGLDGMSALHYSSPWAWPVGTSAAAMSRIVVRRARDAGARTFAVVYDNWAAWGAESAAAMDEYVKSLGGTMRASIALDPGKPSYVREASEFNDRCAGGSCDMVLLALHTTAANTWLLDQPGPATGMGGMVTAALPTLMSDRFGRDCAHASGVACNGLMVLDPFKPPVGPFTDEPAVARYRSDAEGDVSALVESAAVGARVLVEALVKLGPNVTRSGLAAVLNDSTVDVGLTHPLDWAASDRRGNRWALGMTLQVAQGGFTGWKDAETGWLADPRPT